jgi:peptidyl-dipeptidase Dcp
MQLLTHVFQTPFNSAPFSQIRNEDYQPAFEANIEKARAEIDAITQNAEAPTFENTIEALE